MRGFHPVFGLLVLALGAGSASPQTRIDLRTQSKSVDFSGAPSTKPSKTGTTLPATCSVGELFYKSDAPAGANLHGCTAINTWSVLGWVSTASQLGDLGVEYLGSTRLRIGAQCTPSTPCNVRIGGTVHAFTTSAVATLNSGTGIAYFYVTKDGALTVGHNLTLSCAGCTQEPATSFPSGSVPLFRWTATNGAWDSNAGTDWRAFLSNHPVSVGTGLVGVDAGGRTLISVDVAVVGRRVAVPASSASSCTSGSWAADRDYYYVCYQDSAWKRVALTSW